MRVATSFAAAFASSTLFDFDRLIERSIRARTFPFFKQFPPPFTSIFECFSLLLLHARRLQGRHSNADNEIIDFALKFVTAQRRGFEASWLGTY
jgi:hypothetical protein